MGDCQRQCLLSGRLILAMSFLNPVNKSLCLEQLCESNYQKLFKLIPELMGFEKYAMGTAPNNAALYLDIIEQSPYTITIELSYSFHENLEHLLSPTVSIRLYLDLQLAEVLSDHARASVKLVFKNVGMCREIMNYKWRLNYFLHKWLDHCLKKRLSLHQSNRRDGCDWILAYTLSYM